MKQLKPVVLSMLTIAGLAAGAAAAAEPGTSGRTERQQQRIEQGWRSGDLNRNEVRRLEGEQRQIRQERRQYAADGNVDRFERADLRRDLNGADRHIYNERHDGNRRDWNARSDNGRHYGRDRGSYQQGRRDVRYDGRQGAGIDRSQWQQREMIERGVRSGRITPVEYRELRGEQRAIRQEERAYRADGYLSGAERTDLRHDLKAARRHIRGEMSDGDRQYY
ncbi:hypothetical protein [Sulfurisoma sediminicola]|uniref:Uncharacterized protein n=1 Tax=Sulfurisoma sediminicola TaxID=1381557 RepID=A0A497XF87_9PROT|nr:hypothetical protein [Sulfurisoma sediminicola]RLJ64808.1 hypothetical protein DFR35_1456 [Sulfurisoma sediminicola]